MTTLTIVHTHAEGTLIEGTSKGDGSGDVLKAHRWRWGRSISAWYVPHSRDSLSKDWIINTTKAALEAAGFEVEVSIDNAVTRTTAEKEADRAERAGNRSEMLAERAQRHEAIANGADAARRQIADYIPLGQPILVGHHSERRHRAAIGRMDSLMGKSVEASRTAQEAQRRSDDLAAATDRRNSPKAVGSRIERLETELRAVTRRLEGSSHTFAGGYVEVTPAATGERAERLAIEKTTLEGDLEYWRGIRAEQVAAGAPEYSAETITKGDLVKVLGQWYKVARVNKKTVSIQVRHGTWEGTMTEAFHKITGHKTAEQVATALAAKAAEGQEGGQEREPVDRQRRIDNGAHLISSRHSRTECPVEDDDT